MKKLGLVGGTGPESTILYYHDIVYGVQKQLGDKVFPPIAIDSIDVFQILGFCERHEYDKLTDYVSRSIHNLAAAGAEFAALTGNTPHIVFEELQKCSPIPLVSSIDTTCEEAKRRNLHCLGLLGTAFTLDGSFFKKPFLEDGIEIVVPTESERQFIHCVISDELELGIKKSETLVTFQKIIERMKSECGIEAIILGCTELPLLLNDNVSPLPCLDTMKIHIEALLGKILSD